MSGSIEDEEIENLEITQDLGEIAIYLYSFELSVQAREFKGKTSGVTKSAVQIECNS